MTTKKRTRGPRRFKGYALRNRFEKKVNDALSIIPGFEGYESDTLEYTIPASVHKYTPDFKIGNTYYEAKGIWDSVDRKKMLLVKEQHPKKEFVMVFYNPNNKIYKGSKTTYADWCIKHGLRWLTVERIQKGER